MIGSFTRKLKTNLLFKCEVKHLVKSKCEIKENVQILNYFYHYKEPHWPKKGIIWGPLELATKR